MQSKDFQPLRECPFCGGDAEIVGGPENWTPTFYDPDSGGDPIAVVCKTCACGLYFFDGYAEAIAAWNRRTQPENEPLTLEELRGMDGESVRIEESPLWYGGNGVVSLAKGGVINPDDPNGCWPFENYGEWLACRSKPKEEV